MNDLEEKPIRGQPTKFNERIQEKMISLAESGKTVEQISEVLDISQRTIYLWLKAKPDLAEDFREAKINADDLVEASLFTNATKNMDTTAQIFWLKNRRRHEWNNSNDSGVTVTNVQNNITIEKVELEDRIKIIKGKE